MKTERMCLGLGNGTAGKRNYLRLPWVSRYHVALSKLMNNVNALEGTKEPCEQKATFSSLLSGNRSEQWKETTKKGKVYLGL